MSGESDSMVYVRVPLDDLHAHPGNANVMDDAARDKLREHIARSGQYPPLIVRPHPQRDDGAYQLLDGHHRAKVLRALGHAEASCCVWDVDDAQAAMLLLTLNRLQGQDNAIARGKLLRELMQHMPLKDAQRLLPDARQQIDRLQAITAPGPVPPPTTPPDLQQMPVAITFFVRVHERTALLARLRAIDATDRNRALLQLAGIAMRADDDVETPDADAGSAS